MRKFLWVFVGGMLVASCSDASIVAGKYSGTFYLGDTAVLYRDTMNVNIVASEISKNTVQIDIVTPLFNITTGDQLTFTDFVTLTKNADQAYNLNGDDAFSIEHLSGNYYEGFLTFYYTNTNSYYSNYMFEGTRK